MTDTITFDSVAGADGYNLYGRKRFGTAYQKLNSGLITGTSFVPTGLGSGYYFGFVTAVVGGVESGPSNSFEFFIDVGGITGLQASLDGDDVLLSWNSITADGFNAYADFGFGFQRLNNSLITTNSFNAGDLQASRVYVSAVRNSVEIESSTKIPAIFYEYFRLKILNDNGADSFMGTTELGIYSSVGGSSQPPGSGGTAFADTENASYPASQAFNNDTGEGGGGVNGWITETASPSYPHHLGYQFTAKKEVREFGLGTYSTSNTTIGRSVGEIIFQGSNDGTNYKDLYYVDLRGVWVNPYEFRRFEL